MAPNKDSEKRFKRFSSVVVPPRKGKINMVCPPDWRQSQTIVNFLTWLAKQRPELLNPHSAPMADPFYMEDNEWEEQYLRFLEQHYPEH